VHVDIVSPLELIDRGLVPGRARVDEDIDLFAAGGGEMEDGPSRGRHRRATATVEARETAWTLDDDQGAGELWLGIRLQRGCGLLLRRCLGRVSYKVQGVITTTRR